MTEYSGLWEEEIPGTGRGPELPRQFLPQTIRPLTKPVKPIGAASGKSQPLMNSRLGTAVQSWEFEPIRAGGL